MLPEGLRIAAGGDEGPSLLMAISGKRPVAGVRHLLGALKLLALGCREVLHKLDGHTGPEVLIGVRFHGFLLLSCKMLAPLGDKLPALALLFLAGQERRRYGDLLLFGHHYLRSASALSVSRFVFHHCLNQQAIAVARTRSS